MKPDIVVTDLDGDITSLKKAGRTNTIMVVHAHGDNSENIQIYGTGNQKRDIIYIDDLINLIIKIFSNCKFNGNIYNVGNSKCGQITKIL